MSRRKNRSEAARYVMISVVSERFGIHPQTLRLYERMGLLKPARSAGNTRLYDEAALERLQTILSLTRDMGVNLAGVEIILRLREQLAELRGQLERVTRELERWTNADSGAVRPDRALIPMGTRAVVRR
jgi:MerR family transcriptional regulator/heat shock protein HspR